MSEPKRVTAMEAIHDLRAAEQPTPTQERIAGKQPAVMGEAEIASEVDEIESLAGILDEAKDANALANLKKCVDRLAAAARQSTELRTTNARLQTELDQMAKSNLALRATKQSEAQMREALEQIIALRNQSPIPLGKALTIAAAALSASEAGTG